MTGRLLTLREAADALGCSVATIKRRIRAGALPAFIDGRLVRVRDIDLARDVAERVFKRTAERPVPAEAGLSLPRGARLWD